MTRRPPTAPSVFARKLVVVTGKGGVGKSTIAAALGLAATHRGLRTIVVELGDQSRLPALFQDAEPARHERNDRRTTAGDARQQLEADRTPQPARTSARTAHAKALTASAEGEEIELEEGLWSVTIDPDRAMLEWLQALGGRVPGRILANSLTFQYFAAAAPGARELVSMVKVWELTRAKRWRKRAQSYDLVVLDAPATGHALGLLRSPHTFGAIARVGPIFGQAEHVRELLEDAAQTAYVAVTLPTEMAIGETVDLRDSLRSQLGVELDRAIVNAVLPARRFSALDVGRIGRLNGARGARQQKKAGERVVRQAAALAAQTAHMRARSQQRQTSKLRRHGMPVLTVPFAFVPAMGLDEVRIIGKRLASSL